MERKFGVELEMNGITQAKAVRVLRAIGINIQNETYNHQRRPHWKIVPDGSVRNNGFEVVSPVLEGEAGLEELRAVTTALKDAGGKIDRSCGFHVHFDAADLDIRHIRSIVTRYAAHEAKIDAFMPNSRRANNNTYCRSVSALTSSSIFQNATNLNQLVNAQPGRYFKVNLKSYQVHGTVEFRQHSGTLDAPKAVNWVRFLAAFINESKAKVDAPAAAPAAQSIRHLRGVQAQLATMFQSATFLSVQAIMDRFSWQAHTVRAAVTRLRQAGLAITREPVNGGPGYRLENHCPAAVRVQADDLFDGVSSDIRTFYNNRAAVLAIN